MPKNWLITDKGDAINLDFLSKVVYGGTFAIPEPNSVFFFHGIAAGKGSTVKYTYGNAITALESFKRVQQVLRDQSIVTDLRNFPALSLASITPTTGGVAGGEKAVIQGAGITAGSVLINGVACPVVEYLDKDFIVVITPPNAAGTYDVVVTNADSSQATLAAAYTYA